MKYKILRIDEDLDFGCEEHSDDQPVMAIVVLEDADGNQSFRREPDDSLYEKDINEGAEVIIDENDCLRKALSDDWTKKCNSSNVNTEKFAAMLMAVKAGKPVAWVCPFCGGKVGKISQDEKQTVIGCDSCDMRIELEND